MLICSIEKCDTHVYARSWCQKHYGRWYKHGDVNYKRPTTEERFWSRVTKTSHCWWWFGAMAGGYGQISVNKTQTPAHRYSWTLHNGEIKKGLFVLHKCDNKRCIKPNHLFLGTGSDNMQDMIKKHGHPKQNNSYWAKLTKEDVMEIRGSQLSSFALANKYGVTPENIQKVQRYETWKNLP